MKALCIPSLLFIGLSLILDTTVAAPAQIDITTRSQQIADAFQELEGVAVSQEVALQVHQLSDDLVLLVADLRSGSVSNALRSQMLRTYFVAIDLTLSASAGVENEEPPASYPSSPPGTFLPTGASAEGIQDPVLRAEYERRFAAQRELLEKYNVRRRFYEESLRLKRQVRVFLAKYFDVNDPKDIELINSSAAEVFGDKASPRTAEVVPK